MDFMLSINKTSEDFRKRLNQVLQVKYDIANKQYPEGYQEAPLAYDAVWSVALGKQVGINLICRYLHLNLNCFILVCEYLDTYLQLQALTDFKCGFCFIFVWHNNSKPYFETVDKLLLR